NDLIDGINDAIIKALPDRQLADQVIDSIENYVAKKTDDLLHEDPKEKRRRSADRHFKESIARKRRHANPEPTPDILDAFPLEEEQATTAAEHSAVVVSETLNDIHDELPFEQDISQYTSEEEFAADAEQLEPATTDPAPADLSADPRLPTADPLDNSHSAF